MVDAANEAGPAAARPWWKPAPFPALAPITTKRAYTEVLLVYLALFAAGIINAGLLLGGRSRDFPSDGSWGQYMSLVAEVLGQIGLAVAVVYLLCARRQVTPADLGTRLPRRDDGRLGVSRTLRVMAWGFLAQIAGGIVNSLLQSGHLPNNTVNTPEQIFGLFDALQAGIIEELVVLAFLVVTLLQARRPLWEITIVALVLRGAYHIYYGPGVVGILLWAALFYWIYLRTRALIPLMLCHFLWDGVAFATQASKPVGAIAVLLVLALFIAAPILWLVERSSRPAQVMWATPGSGALWPTGPDPGGLPHAGWYPDPGSHDHWRWWDGYRWTHFVSLASHPSGQTGEL